MKPCNSQVALRIVPRSERSSAGSALIIPATTRDRTNEGVVIDVGPGEWFRGELIPVRVQKDDRVLFLRNGYQAVVNGAKTFFVREHDILAVLDEDDEAEFVGAAIGEADFQEAFATGL